MKFFRKIEIAKPRKTERTASECLSNGVIQPLEMSEKKSLNEQSENRKTKMAEGVATGVENEGFEAGDEEKKEEEKVEKIEKNKTEEDTDKSIKVSEVTEEVSAIPKRENENVSDEAVKDSKIERRHSSWQNFKSRLTKFFDHPNIIHWIALFLIGLAIWSIIYSIADSDFLPGSQLFSLLVLFVLAFIGGELIKLIKLPPLLGMMLVGLLLRNVNFVHLKGVYVEVASTLREMALCIILIRAGLGLDPKALKTLRFVILRLALVPGIVEGIITMIVTHFLLGLPLLWGMLLGAILAAVSPAVVIPCLFSLQERGYGKDKGIPTLVVAAASLDDIFAITVFGVVLNVIYSTGSNLTMQIVQGPLGIVIGIIFGIFWGLLAQVIPHKNDSQVILLRVLMIVGGGLMAIVGSGAIGYQGAGPLGCIIAAFVACLGWRREGYSEENNPVAGVFRIIWLVFQPILFGLIGSEVDVTVLELSTLGNGLLSLFCSLLGRIVVSIFIGFGAGFNWKEKTFVALAWFPKATVQAALGPLALDYARRSGTEEEITYATKILILAVLAILITAPIGAALITTLGPKLLTKAEASSEPSQRAEEINLRSGDAEKN